MTMNYTKEEVFKAAIELWGEEAQIDMMIEEAGELIVAMCHFKRARKYKPLSALTEEIADVELMLEQIKYMLDIEQDVAGMVRENYHRLEGLIHG